MALIHIGGKSYELMHENRNGWNPEAFRNRYSEVLERYDYIIGDWGYNQLRLKGFFRDGHQKAVKESSFSSVSDYINEYCNFGCAYFILEKKQGANREPDADDLDLNIEPDAPRLEGYDLRAAVESAAASSAGESDHDFENAVRSAPVRKESHGGARHRSNQSHGSHHHGSGKSHHHSSRQQDHQSASAEGGEGKRRDQPFRKNNRNRHHDNRGKKPVKIAASESAAASEGHPKSQPLQ